MVKEDKRVFCFVCGIRIDKGWFLKPDGVEFKDGWKCEACFRDGTKK